MNYTYTDISNSATYAKMKLLSEKVKNLNNPNVKWVSNPVPYYCPPGLKCEYGTSVIASKSECNTQNKYDASNDYTKKPPNSQNGWFLSWNASDNNCYKQNHIFKHNCLTDFTQTDPTSKPTADIKHNATLYYDDNTHQCNITQDYCKAYGYNEYDPGSDATSPPFKDRACSMGGWQTAADALFGDTIARGFLTGQGCKGM